MKGMPPVTPTPTGASRHPERLPGFEYFPARQGSAEATDQLRAESPVIEPDAVTTEGLRLGEFPADCITTGDDWDPEYSDWE